MKVRWMCDSLRLRITPTELRSLVAGQIVSERLQFDVNLSWEVDVKLGESQTELTSKNGAVIVLLSKKDLELLQEPEREGVYFSLATGAGELKYYIEKDYPCIHPRSDAAGETPTETFLRS